MSEHQPTNPVWQPMATAPRNGRSFVRLVRTTIIGGGPPCYEFHIEPLRRRWVSPDSEGAWMGAVYSQSDEQAAHGWWATRVPVDPQGRILMPVDALPRPHDAEGVPDGE